MSEIKRDSLPAVLISMEVKRPNNKGFFCYFKNVQHLKNFIDMIQTIIENAKKAGATEPRKVA